MLLLSVGKERIRSYIFLLIVAAIWGIAGPVIKYTLPDFTPMIFLTYRLFVSSILMLPIAWVLKPKFPTSRREIIMLSIAGLFGTTFNLGLLFYGLNLSNVLDATIIGNTSPIFVILGGVFFLREKVNKKELLGIIVTLLGTLIIIVQPLFDKGFVGTSSLLGNIFLTLANITWVVYIVITKTELRHKIDIFLITTYMFILGFITSLPFALFEAKGLNNLLLIVSLAPFKAHLGVWYLAVLSGSLGYFLYQEGQKKIEASEATLFGYLSPLFSTPLAVFWLKEKITTTFIIGTLITATGVFIAEYRRNSKK